ncbi:hypothetical protein POM88_039926 [Heracleum sosnowskyi]|uniref:Uncharacterized protein n=1 Tax=Heracleum sosnowskyi TaxID=360622 RepID=A0AAD8M6W1_9APIA|nr:hypothetical protein POM88_039926 [Heracleum sosnowskyi]
MVLKVLPKQEMREKPITREFFPLKGGALKENVVKLESTNDLNSRPIQEDDGAHENPPPLKLIICQLRKPRRRWTEDLNYRFIMAIENLGGAFVATPKQIQQWMGVADLTYNEIQSHLQQHRMHIRRA